MKWKRSFRISYKGGSLSARRVWIEIYRHIVWRQYEKSLSARRVWIEIELVH